MITSKRLREVITYNPETGAFTWMKTLSNRAVAGSITGLSKDTKGYAVIRVDGRLYRAHRLAVLYMTGELPRHDVDHINGIRDDNRWSNLRQAERWQNISNKRISSNNKSGIKGVCWNSAHKRWLATIKHKGRQIYIGEFTDKLDAAHAVAKARDLLHGEFARHN